MTAIIDAHAHCGVKDKRQAQTYQDYARLAAGTQIDGVVFFPPVMEIYDRYDPNFTDSAAWQEERRQSNAYLLSLRPSERQIYPYFFIWNDFAVEQLSAAHCGIKWHRHACEPVYHYVDPKCRAALDEIRKRHLPVVLEEEFANTLKFISDLARGIQVVIPHLGGLNGGFLTIAEAGLWEYENVWADTALASSNEISAYIQRYGHRRLMFGSDFPFGDPAWELHKLRSLGLDPEVEAAVAGGNFLRLQGMRG
jgi:predicted TIM-barrel fold metal-dependent hydrolase